VARSITKQNLDFVSPLSGAPTQSPSRSVGDKILSSFSLACERDELEVAALMLVEYEGFVTRPPITLESDRRREMELLVSAHSRLWELLRASIAE